MTSQRVLVTGGAGFIGRYVCRELRRQGQAPVVYDVRAPEPSEGFEWARGDILDEASLAGAARETTAIIHLASLLSVEATERRPRETLDVAVLGTRNVCRIARPEQRLVFASTSEVYGDASEVPTPETCPPSPKSVYGAAKLAAEQYVRTCVGPSGPHFTILRFFSVYGAGQSPGFVVPRFAAQAVRGEPITVYGDGSQVRAFTHVTDTARGTVLALRSPEAAGKTYNIGNPSEPVTIGALARRVVALAESPSPVRQVPFASSDRSAAREIYRRIPDIRAAASDLGFAPTKTLDEGIQDVLAHLRT